MKVYKLKDTTETGVVIVNISSKISESLHQILEKLSGDLFLIFPESITKTIDPIKFSRLYGATWYGIYKEDIVSGVWGALDYLEELTKYTSYSVLQSSFLLSNSVLKALQRLQYSGIETSVFGSRELTREEKEKLYTIKPRLIEIAFGWRFKFFLPKNSTGMYSKRTTQDQLLFLRPISIKKMREIISPEILHSFYGLGVGSFLASIIPEDTHINMKIDEAKV